MSTRSTPTLDLLMVRDDDHSPVLGAGLSQDQARCQPAPATRPKPGLLWGDEDDPDDLRLQRWGVIAPKGPVGDRLLELIAPLCAHRMEAQGGADVRIYRLPPGMTMEQATRWKKRYFRRGDQFEHDLPRYQLILGDLDQVSLAVQHVQATDGFVGRLAFDREEDYCAYVDKLLRWERAPSRCRTGSAILHTVRDGTDATERGHHALMSPGARLLQKRRSFDQLPVSDVSVTGSAHPCPDELWAAVDTGRPSVLFTLGHGVGAPRAGWTSSDAQRRRQGAMSFGKGGVVTGENVAERSFLSGGVWCMLSCFGAGTPMTSEYHHWLDTLRRAGHVGKHIEHVLDTLALERPFIAALPKAALCNPDGPLAVIGHIDLAWSYSFMEVDDGAMKRPSRFMGVVQALLRGRRAGLSMRSLTRGFEQANAELTALYNAHARTGRAPLDMRARAHRAHLWMLRQDLAGYVLLGDPAARLPLARADADTSGDPPAVADTELDRAVMAVSQVIGQRMGLAAAARAYELPKDQLERLIETYREAGRKALGQALAHPSAGSDRRTSEDGA